ncbi:hypothetical protein HDU89_000291 [Geranomyces variabilis]|nr:hypothetical protein HDU89_000291 [Geranomyces variabilis]
MSPAGDSTFCRWQVSVHDCDDSPTFIGIAYTACSMCVVMLVTSTASLIVRGRTNPVHRLWKVELASFDMFLLWNGGFFAFVGALYFLILAADYAPIASQPAAMAALNNLMWSIGRVSLWIYTFSLLRNTPRTSKRVKLPSQRHLEKIMRALIAVDLLLATPLAALSGHELSVGSISGYQRWALAMGLCDCVQNATLGVGMWYFGGQMVMVAQENRDEMKELGALKSESAEMLNAKLDHAILKMQMTNMAAMSTLTFFALLTAVYAFIPDTLMGCLWWSKLQMLGGHAGAPGLFAMSHIVILWAELQADEVPKDMLGILHKLRVDYYSRKGPSKLAKGENAAAAASSAAGREELGIVREVIEEEGEVK